ncbi:MAG: c-type cytochrome [Thermomicrobiales bacterium]
MGAVQKLATVVIIGLVALATLLTVYIADEPNRRGGEISEQDVVAIERGTELYIQYCLQCHGTDGQGYNGDPNRIGAPLNQIGVAEDAQLVTYQSDDPADQAAAESFIRYRLLNGAPSDPRIPKIMPAFGTELNVEEINELVYLVMNVDWNYVYNESVLASGETLAEECTATPDLEECGELAVLEDGNPVAYPTVPPTAVPEGEEASPEAEAEGPAPVAEVNASDQNQWSVTEISASPGDTISVNNPGVVLHDFVVDELTIDQDLTGGAQTTITIPEDAAPGTYTFYCSVPGHRQAGMEGTITIE